MPVPYIFGTATSAIPLSQLDSNFATAITLGNTAVYLGNTTTSINALTLTNVTISSGTVSLTNATVTTANVTTGNITNMISSNVAITGGTISGVTMTLDSVNNTPVGNATPSTGAFTTLTATTPLGIASGGTNSSATPIAGSVGYGTGTAHAYSSAGTSGQALLSGGAGAPTFGTLGTGAGGTGLTSFTANGVVYASSTSVLATGSSFVFDGTNVGIGTSSPTQRLDVRSAAGIIYLNSTTGTNQVALQTNNSGGDFYFGIDNSAGNNFNTGTAYAGVLWRSGANPICFVNNNTERMRLDSSGNLGLGVTPSAWSTGIKVLQLGAYSSVGFDSSNSTWIGNNWSYNGSYKFLSTGYASYYFQNGGNGQHQWFTSTASGTAGNAITFTQAMTLDASGNLVVGTSGGNGQYIGVNTNASSTGFFVYNDTSSTILSAAAAVPMIFRTGNTERMRIDSSGNLLVGTTSALGKATIYGSDSNAIKIDTKNAQSGTLVEVIAAGSTAYGIGGWDYSGVIEVTGGGAGTSGFVLSAYNGPMIFQVNNRSERMRIDSSGNLLVGTTSPANGTTTFSTAGNSVRYTFLNTNNANGNYGLAITYQNSTPNGTGNEFILCNDPGATRMTVRSNGGIANYQANNVNLSDQQEKKDIELAGSYLDKICAIPVKTFLYNDQNDTEKNLGVIAQDVQAVAPELVSESNWGTEEEPKMRLSIYQTDLQYALMKCIQELKSELDSVKAELATLKG